MKEKWLVQSKRADFYKIAEKYHILPVIARIIRNRDIVTGEEIDLYLHGTLDHMHSPHLLKDLEKAVKILNEKIRKRKKMRVIGDYDIDGVCSGNILVRGLKLLGADVEFTVPDRILDGYGLQIRMIEEAIEDKIDTLITCDNGIAAYREILAAKKAGITVIVTDHHEVPEEIPPADAIINPKQKDCKYPFKDICGAVVAFKLIQEMFAVNGADLKELNHMLELAALATVGDVVDLRDENRVIVRSGLKLLQKSENPGIQALKEVNHLTWSQITSYHIGFVLGPCLNAGGRLDTAMKAYRLLSGDEDCSMALAQELKELNDRRKQMTAEAVNTACLMVEQDLAYEKDTVLVLFIPDCHESLAGIVAGRIREKYHKPVFVITRGNEMLKGSGRSIEGYSMYEELCKCSHILERYGGHEMAAGISLREEHLLEFRRQINDHSPLTEEDLICKVWIDAVMPFEYVNTELVNQLKMLEPFGKGNPKPVFAERNLEIRGIKVLGTKRNMIKLVMVNETGCFMDGIYFSEEALFMAMMKERFSGEDLDLAARGQKNKIRLNITYFPEINEYNQRKYLQVVIGRIM